MLHVMMDVHTEYYMMIEKAKERGESLQKLLSGYLTLLFKHIRVSRIFVNVSL